MSSKQKINIQKNNFINNLNFQLKNNSLNVDIVINDNFFINNIANGSIEYRKYNLQQLLKKEKLSNNANIYDTKFFNEITQKLKNNPLYLDLLKINEHKMFKYFGTNNINELCSQFNLDLEKIKNEHLFYKNELKKLPQDLQSILNFINKSENETKFLKESHLVINLQNYCNFLELPETDVLIKEFNYIIQKENEKIYKEQQKIEQIKQAEEIKRENIKRQEEVKKLQDYLADLKVKKGVSPVFIYPLLNHKYINTVLEKNSLKDLAKYLGVKLSNNNHVQEELIRKYKNLIHNMYVSEILNITPTELKKWKEEQKLVPTQYKEFYKWGKTLVSAYFSAEYLSLITPDIIEKWRLNGQLKKKIKKDTTDTSKTDISKSIKLIQEVLRLGYYYINNKWYFLSELNLYNYSIKHLFPIKLKNDINTYKTSKGLLSDLVLTPKQIETETKKIYNKINSYELSIEMKEKLLIHLSKHTKSIKEFLPNTTNEIIESNLKIFLKIKQQQEIIKELKVENYEIGYLLARSMERKIKIIVGPTNSGKTYEALQHMSQAKSGVYLAPLRLLAMEIYDKLNSLGVPCNLITGEEKIIIPGANHTSSTVEMMNPENSVEVAIIDEFQMLDDVQRGWAWTSAMVGVPAKTVYVIGNEQKLNIAVGLYKHLEENCEIIKKERFNTLEVVPKLINIDNLKKGDALIAFSRKDILSYATLLRQNNYKVSIIYGALSPEVRRKQADMFLNGETDIVVSTDAIGMGLNLPIQRIIFATINKFDGTSVRELKNSEFLQIAGRAGRYGLHEKGFVGLLNNKVNPDYKLDSIKLMLKNSISASEKKLSIAPTNWHLNTISKALKTKNLSKILLYFSNLRYNSIYETANLENQIILYQYIKDDIKECSLTEQYHFLTAPIELKNENLIDYYSYLIENILAKNSIKFYMNNLHNLRNLAQAEFETKKITLYSWLSFYYDNLNTDDISKCREKLSDFIQKKLLEEKTYGFSQMIKPREKYYY